MYIQTVICLRVQEDEINVIHFVQVNDVAYVLLLFKVRSLNHSI